MNFTILSSDNSCNCHRSASEDLVSSFVRKVEYNKELKARDFKTHHERGKLPGSQDCKEVCGIRGLSIEIWNDNSREHLIEKYLRSYGISPKLKPKSQIVVFQFLEGCGKVKHTPDQKSERNIYHYDLYKSDEFTLEKICLLETIPLIDGDV